MLWLDKRIILFLRKYILKYLGIKDHVCNLYLSGSAYNDINKYIQRENNKANVINIDI